MKRCWVHSLQTQASSPSHRLPRHLGLPSASMLLEKLVAARSYWEDWEPPIHLGQDGTEKVTWMRLTIEKIADEGWSCDVVTTPERAAAAAAEVSRRCSRFYNTHHHTCATSATSKIMREAIVWNMRAKKISRARASESTEHIVYAWRRTAAVSAHVHRQPFPRGQYRQLRRLVRRSQTLQRQPQEHQ